MCLPPVRLRLWKLMVAIIIVVGLMAEICHRPARFGRLSMMHHDRANACLDRAGRVCKLGQTPTSIENFYHRQGPVAWQDWKTAQYHFRLAAKYADACNGPWLPVLPDGLPPGNPRDVGATADWAKETLSAVTTFIGILVVLLIHTSTPRQEPDASVRSRAAVRRSAVPPPG